MDRENLDLLVVYGCANCCEVVATKRAEKRGRLRLRGRQATEVNVIVAVRLDYFF